MTVALLMVSPAVSHGADPRPGQLARVLSGLQDNGKNWSRDGLSWLLQREYVTHLMFMATDEGSGTSGGGFYGPSQGRYGWQWLSKRLDRDEDDAITFEEFSGPREWFEALDKDRDGLLTEEDFAWYGSSALAKASGKAKSLFSQIDRDSDGQVSADEWKLWFQRLRGSKAYLAQDDLLPVFMETKKSWRAAGKNKGMKRDRTAVVASYISSDIGSPWEGPAIGGMAPDFTLSSMHGPEKLSLSGHRGKKPLVLIFGSFT